MTALQPAIPLTAGDAVATVAASSALADDHRVQEGLEVLRGWGLCPLEQNVSARPVSYTHLTLPTIYSV